MNLRCFPSTLSKELIWVAFKFAFTIAGYVHFGMRNSYLNNEGKGFNSALGAFVSSDEGIL